MIGRLRGKLVADEIDVAVIDVGGVGYEVNVPLGTLGRAARHEDGTLTLVVHTHVREDALLLYGFATDADRTAFRILLGVSSVGPRTAIAVLSTLPAGELSRAIATKDVAKLTSIPGIGKKTAERLALELRDKLPNLGPSTPTGASKSTPIAPAGQSDVLLSALTRMGYKTQEAERAIAEMGDRVHELPLADALREALAFLVK